MKTTRVSILWTLGGCLLLSAEAWAGYVAATVEFPPPCLKEIDKSSPLLMRYGGGGGGGWGEITLGYMMATRTGQSIAPPPEGSGDTVSSFFDIFLEVSTDGGGTWATGVAYACDSFFDIFTEMGAGGAGGAGGAQGCSGLNATMSVPSLGMPLMIRESPTRASSGRFATTAVAGGYMIDSFFDIFIEISIDGGGTWQPSTAYSQDGGITWEPGEYSRHLVAVPEPATLSLLALGGLAITRRRR